MTLFIYKPRSSLLMLTRPQWLNEHGAVGDHEVYITINMVILPHHRAVGRKHRVITKMFYLVSLESSWLPTVKKILQWKTKTKCYLWAVLGRSLARSLMLSRAHNKNVFWNECVDFRQFRPQCIADTPANIDFAVFAAHLHLVPSHRSNELQSC